jgi:hypothetical protein
MTQEAGNRFERRLEAGKMWARGSKECKSQARGRRLGAGKTQARRRQDAGKRRQEAGERQVGGKRENQMQARGEARGQQEQHKGRE